MHFEQPIPADMQAVIEKWRRYNKAKGLMDE
jgi:hypothetical protein